MTEPLSWTTLQDQTAATPVGKALNDEVQLRQTGQGSAARENTLRKFGSKAEPAVTLYRDHAAWCPYCQKTMLLVEEKEIPIKIDLVNMRSYGDKPQAFLRKIPNGLLPAIEVQGQVVTESQVIMELLDEWFPESQGYRRMQPKPDDVAGQAKYRQLAQLERELFSWWCTVVFRPEQRLGPFGGGMSGALKGFMECLQKVDDYLQSTKGPWFFDEFDHPTMIDFIYVSHVERMLASVAHWKGVDLRDVEKWNLKGLVAWLEAFEQRPAYLAFKSDYYTHVMDIPPQYGPGYDGGFDKERKLFSSQILGTDGKSWHLPLSFDDPLQPLYKGPPLPACVLEAAGIQPDQGTEQLSYESCPPQQMERACRSMAAWKLAGNGPNVAKFAARGGPKGSKNPRKTFSAPLADPYAEPDQDVQPFVDAALRIVCMALLDMEDGDGSSATLPSATLQDALKAAVPKSESPGVASSLAYMRDRVGVPRDLPLASARYLRAYLNWAIETLEGQ